MRQYYYAVSIVHSPRIVRFRYTVNMLVPILKIVHFRS